MLEELPGRDERLYREYYLQLLRGQIEGDPVGWALKRLLKCGLIATIKESKLRTSLLELDQRRENWVGWRKLAWRAGSLTEANGTRYRSHCQTFRAYEMAIRFNEKQGTMPNEWLHWGHGAGDCYINISTHDVSPFF